MRKKKRNKSMNVNKEREGKRGKRRKRYKERNNNGLAK